MMAIVLAGAARSGNPEELHRSAVGFFSWMLFAMVGMSGAEVIMGAAAAGTLEKMLSGPIRHSTIILSELISNGTIGLMRSTIVFVILASIIRIPLHASLAGLATLVLFVAFMIAVGLGLSGLTLVTRRTVNVGSYLQLAMLGLALIASNQGVFARPLQFFPFTLAIRLLDAPVITPQDLEVLALGTLVTTVVAGLVFVWADRRALRRGLLSTY
jgi:hypothetical protein